MVEVHGETMEGHRTFLGVLGDDPPLGLIVRAAGPTDTGIRIITVWESKAAHDRFIAERLYPTMAQVNRSGFHPEVVAEFQVEEVWTPGAAALLT